MIRPYLIKKFNYSSDIRDVWALFKTESFLFFLNSSQQNNQRGRFSFIGFDPFQIIRHSGKESLMVLKNEFKKYAKLEPADETPLPAGMVGFLSYDYGLSLEKIKLQIRDSLKLPDCMFGFYDLILTMDHWENKLYVVSTGLPFKDGLQRHKKAQARLEYACRKIETLLIEKESMSISVSDTYREEDFDMDKKFFHNNFSKDDFIKTVEKALDYIKRGDIYQVNISQRFECPWHLSPADTMEVYKRLSTLSPTCFSAYFDGGDLQIISSSPEQFLHLQNGIVLTRPMKGTRPRGKDKRQDEFYRRDILNSSKERAELLMITDLLRNDLGKVCEYGSVTVKEMRVLEEYKNIFQTASTIEGKLREDKDGFDLLGACFPGGSVTGCPKIRAMEIIEELEPTRRGIYTGSLGYMSFSGPMDFNILIRTILVHQNKLYFQVGSGIVADSRPEAEYAETLLKAEAIQSCLNSIFSINV